MSVPSIKLNRESGAYTYGPVEKCASCYRDHEILEVVLRDDRVWYRCPKQGTLVFIRRVNVRL